MDQFTVKLIRILRPTCFQCFSPGKHPIRLLKKLLFRKRHGQIAMMQLKVIGGGTKTVPVSLVAKFLLTQDYNSLQGDKELSTFNIEFDFPLFRRFFYYGLNSLLLPQSFEINSDPLA